MLVRSNRTSGTMEMNEKFFYDPYEVICPECKDLNNNCVMYYCNSCDTFFISGYIVADNKISNQLTKG